MPEALEVFIIKTEDDLKKVIAHNLRPFNLTQEDAAKIGADLFKIHSFLLSDGKSLHSHSSTFDYESKVRDVADAFKDSGLTEDAYVAAAIRQPSLFCRSPKTVIANVRDVVAAFKDSGLTEKDYVMAAVKQPSLFSSSPQTTIANVRDVVAAFKDSGLTEKDYVAATVERPSLFGQSPQTIIANIRGVVAAFKDSGLTEKDYVAAAVKQPSLFSSSPQTIIANIRGVVAAFKDSGLAEKDYVAAAVKQPSLFSSSPQTIIANIRGVVAAFKDSGLTEKNYIATAVRRSTLFYSSPQTITEHVNLAAHLYRRGAVTLDAKKYRAATSPEDIAPLLKWLTESRPVILSYASDNFTLRWAHLEILGKKSSNILTPTRTQIEKELMNYLGHNDPQQPVSREGYDPNAAYDPRRPEDRHGALCRLIEAKCIKSLKFA